MQDINQLAKILFTIENYFQNSRSDLASHANRTSLFWKDIFGARQNFPDLNQILSFRRSNYTYGIGDDRQADVVEEEKHFQKMVTLFQRMVPSDYFLEVAEPCFGAPYFFKIAEVHHSTSFVINAGTANRIKYFVEKYSNQKKNIKVCEIGAGWGGAAYQLHQILDIKNYTIVDLPENLLLSGINLAMSLTGRSLNCIETKEVCKEIQPNTINIALPNALSCIEEKFDLIINTFSLQEMDFESVQEYMTWALHSLSEAGIFVSINSHGKAGIQSPQEYGYDNFHIHHLGVFRKAPVGYFNTIPYEVVLSKKEANDHYDSTQLNVIGEIMQLGLDENLDYISEAVLMGNDAFKNYLDCINLFLKEIDVKKKQEHLDLAKLARGDEAVTHYIQENFYFILKNYPDCIRELNASIEKGLVGFALFKAKILRHICLNVKSKQYNPVIDDFKVEEEELLTVYPELMSLLKERDITAFNNQIHQCIWKKYPEKSLKSLSSKINRKISGFYHPIRKRLTKI